MPDHDATHGCPIPGCRIRQIPVGLLMCPFHWRLVPRPLQQALYHAWNRGRMRADYLEVRTAAINAVIDATVVK